MVWRRRYSRVLDLNGIDVDDLGRAAQRLAADFRQSDVPDLALVLQLLQLLGGLLDWRLPVDT